MKCERCGETVSVEELSEVDQNFYVDDRIFCIPCAKARWETEERIAQEQKEIRAK